MFATSILFAVIAFMAIGFWLMDQLTILIPYRPLLFTYATPLLFSAAVLFLNLFAAMYWLNRKFFLKDAGRKLVHFDKQLRTGTSALSGEIAERLEE
jgi:hypothetical protein